MTNDTSSDCEISSCHDRSDNTRLSLKSDDSLRLDQRNVKLTITNNKNSIFHNRINVQEVVTSISALVSPSLDLTQWKKKTDIKERSPEIDEDITHDSYNHHHNRYPTFCTISHL